jgi:glycosyltransferase involved in cell wall biosynthesis
MAKNMRILYISSKKNWGGVTNWMNQTAMGLEKRGHDIHIIAHPNGRFVRSASPKLNIIPKKLGMDYNPAMIATIRSFVRQNQIDLVVTNIEKEVMIGGAASRLAKIPNIRRVGREDDFNMRLRVKWHHRLFVDRCIVPCDLIRDNAIKRAPWLDPSVFTTIYNGRNPAFFSQEDILKQRRKWDLSTEDIVLGVTTQLTKVKEVDRLIRAFALLLRTHPNCYLVVTGEGPERRGLESLARDLEVSHRVIFNGFTSDPLLTAASYDIAVSSSRFEGFPNTVVEYFAVARPVVTTDAGGVLELVEHMHNGFIVPCRDEKKLYDGLETLVQNDSLREQLGRNALKRIQERFSEDAMLDSLETLFEETIANHAISKQI